MKTFTTVNEKEPLLHHKSSGNCHQSGKGRHKPLPDHLEYETLLLPILINGILCDFFILTLEKIIVLNEYCTYKCITNLFPKYHMSKHYRT